MNALTAEFLSGGFKVLGFPCNNFYLQEPGNTASEILGGLASVRPGGGYIPFFQMFKKIDVNGKDEHTLYTFLKGQCGPTSDVFQDGLYYDPKKVSDVRWNFEIFLINKMGLPVYRYSPDHDVMSIAPDIRSLINTPIETILREDIEIEEKEVNKPEVQVPNVEFQAENVDEVDAPKPVETPAEGVNKQQVETVVEIVEIVEVKKPEV